MHVAMLCCQYVPLHSCTSCLFELKMDVRRLVFRETQSMCMSRVNVTRENLRFHVESVTVVFQRNAVPDPRFFFPL